MSDDRDQFVIWSIEHHAWWRPWAMGYCETLAEAGRYSRQEAAQIVERANTVEFHECMIPLSAFGEGDQWR